MPDNITEEFETLTQKTTTMTANINFNMLSPHYSS